MNTTSQRNIAITVAVILLLGSGYLLFHSLDISKELKSVRIEKENVLSEKIDLNKNLEALKRELKTVSGKNTELISILEATRDRLAEKEKELAKLRQSLSTLSTFKKKSSDLEAIKRDLDQKILELNKNAVALKEQIGGLEQQVANVKADKAAIESKLNDLLNKPFSDNYRTEAQRGRRNILTVIARRTNRLNISMDVPNNLQQAVNFTITTPDGKSLSSAGDLSKEVKIVQSDASFVVDKGVISGSGETMKRVQLVYSPAKKLKKGIYKYQLYSGIQYIGSVQVNLK
ncbi:MAG: hypothetical protein D4R64_00050 [Porphyromonadaceae bacterium]|nr:MAG: hypothetical protein D4R64_00050 [Porphyromonadaceae bacterium]